MTGGGNFSGTPETPAGGPARHVPVMLAEVLAALQPKYGETIIDGTFGAGGYSRAIIEAGAQVIAIDRDPNAIADGQGLADKSGGRLRLAHGRYSNLDVIAGSPVDGVVLDIGVSSMQIDEDARGFSFMRDGPLDMRMERDGPSAADVVNRCEPNDLIRIIGILGEERHASRVARAIAERRKSRPILRTGELAALVEATLGRKPGDRIHPATRTFQGLRIYVNRELEELAAGLHAAERVLREGGRLVVVTFHSLEDRIVKRFLADRSGDQAVSRHAPQAKPRAATFRLEKRGAIAVSEAEADANPRARSAKLRFGIRTGAAARAADMSIFGLANLPALESFVIGAGYNEGRAR